MPSYKDLIQESLILPSFKFGLIAEAVAGNFTVTGIRPRDKLLKVLRVLLVLTEGVPNTLAWTVSDVTSEFTISADNIINNTGGTTFVDAFGLVVWLAIPASVG